MKINSVTKEQWTIAAILAAAVGVLLVLLQKKLPLRENQKQPDKAEGSPAILNPTLGMYPHDLEKYKPYPGNNLVVLPVRYPHRAGHEVTCLIQQGYTALYRPRKDLFPWIDTPPTEGG